MTLIERFSIDDRVDSVVIDTLQCHNLDSSGIPSLAGDLLAVNAAQSDNTDPLRVDTKENKAHGIFQCLKNHSNIVVGRRFSECLFVISITHPPRFPLLHPQPRATFLFNQSKSVIDDWLRRPNIIDIERTESVSNIPFHRRERQNLAPRYGS